MERRQFIKGLLGLAALSIVPPAIHPSAPARPGRRSVRIFSLINRQHPTLDPMLNILHALNPVARDNEYVYFDLRDAGEDFTASGEFQLLLTGLNEAGYLNCLWRDKSNRLVKMKSMTKYSFRIEPAKALPYTAVRTIEVRLRRLPAVTENRTLIWDAQAGNYIPDSQVSQWVQQSHADGKFYSDLAVELSVSEGWPESISKIMTSVRQIEI
jgi:hypothetical protein